MTRGKIEKRGQRRRKVKPVILIVTEGSQTEPKYFEHYRTKQTNIDIRVIGSRTTAGETDYVSLIRKAAEYQKQNDLSTANGDSIWVIADGDVNYNAINPVTKKNQQLIKARKMAASREIHLIISNPCFEFWYLLHFQYTTKYFKDYSAVRALLVKYLANYEKAEDVFDKLEPLTQKAVQNAKHVDEYHLRKGDSLPFGLHTNPFTDVYHLIDLLLSENFVQ